MAESLVITPTYNERENVEAIARATLAALPSAEHLFVDDNSPDGTGDLLDRMAAADPRIHVIHRPGKQGLGRAYVAGFLWALERDYRFIFEMDADFSHNPADLPRLRSLADEADLVLGSRFVGGIRITNWPLSRLMLSVCAAAYVRLVTGMPFADPTGGFKCYRREVIEELDVPTLRSNGYSFQIETLHRAWIRGFRIVEAPIIFEDRRSGVSKMNRSIISEAMFLVGRLWLRSGLRRRPVGVHPRSVAARRPS
ncbi:MAG: polyprenol monophosphomannose synthase [Kiritimatiellae bacterium]|nr:polyprenol monophosphomannose synthase [Kiritimatiellia bacterium]